MEFRASVFDAGDLRRAHTRIAHEIVERNHGADDLVLVGLYTRGPAIARRLAAAIERFEGREVPVGSLDVAFYRDDIALRAVTPGRGHRDPRRHRRPGRRARRRRPLHRPHRPGRDGRPHRARPPPRRPARGPDRPRSPRAADPARLRGQEPAHRARRRRPRAPVGGRRRRRRHRAVGGQQDEALPVDRRPRRREPHRAARPLRAVRRGEPARHPEGPRAARQGGGVALLRGLDPHPPQLRDRGQAPLLRRHDLQRRAVVGEEGREPARHRADHRRHGHRRHRRPSPGGRRAPPHRRLDRRVGHQRGRRPARAPHPGAARRAHPAPPPRARRAAGRDRRRRAPLAGRPQQREGAAPARRRGHAGRAAHPAARSRSRAGRCR